MFEFISNFFNSIIDFFGSTLLNTVYPTAKIGGNKRKYQRRK